MVLNPEPGEKSEISEGWTGNGDLKDGQKELEKESDGEEEREEESEGQVSRTESEKELNGEKVVEKWSEDGSLADDEADDEEEEEEDEEDEGQLTRTSAGQAFIPLVTVIHPSSKQLDLNESSACWEEPQEKLLELVEEPSQHMNHQHPQQHLEWTTAEQKPERRCGCCGETVTVSVCLLAAAVLFPVLVWVGYEFLPFDTPPLSSAPFRLVFTLRCAFFATLPIILGVLVEGLSWVKFATLKPLFEGKRGTREVIIHGNYVRDSLHLYILYFTQLAVMATYISQDMLKLVPLLTIVFVFGRLIYWVCVVFGSSVRSLGFGLSFLPVMVLVGTNLYFVCSSQGQGAVFDLAPPTTAPPPKRRWWG